MRRLARALFAPALFALCAACPEQVGLPCPPSATAVGNFDLVLSLQHPAEECIVNQIDGGAADASLGASTVHYSAATLCEKPSGDGGLTLSISIPSHGVTTGYLVDGGGYFLQTPQQAPASGTACGCPVGLQETEAGDLLGFFDGGTFALQSDGGLPFITGLSGTVTDRVTTPGGGAQCFCKLPCELEYDLVGKRL